MNRLDTLLQMGHWLDSIDMVMEQNFAGFNRPDKDAWPFVAARAFEPELARFLRKYRRQLVEQYTKDICEQMGFFAPVEDEGSLEVLARVTSEAEVQFLIGPGRLSGNDFTTWHTLVKSYGCVFSSRLKVWLIPASRVRGFDAEAFRQQVMLELNLPVLNLDTALATARANPILDRVLEHASRARPQSKPTIAISRSESGLFSISFSFNRALVDFFSNKAGQISGITAYNPQTKARETRSLELVEEIIEKVTERFPEYEIVLEGVDEARREREERQELLRQPIPEVQALLAPGFALRPYQNEMVRFLLQRDGRVLIGDEMGLGKTLQSLSWVAARGKKVLVVAPKNARRMWIKESVKFFPGYFKPIELKAEQLRAGKITSLDGYNLACVNYESVGKVVSLVLSAGFDTIIIDESHRIKNPKAKTTQTLLALGNRFQHRILMSGTAIKNKKAELFNQLQLVAPELFPTVQSLRNTTIGDTWNTIQKCYLARTKAVVAKDLPPKITSIVKMDIEGLPDWSGSEAAVREAMEDPTGQDMEALENAAFDIGEVARLQHAIALGKVEATVDFVNEILEGSDQKVIVFTINRTAAEQIAAALGPLAILHHGQMSDDKREAAKDRFEAAGSPERVFVTTIQSCREAVTLNAASAVVFNSLPWTAADVAQAEARCHRIGQTKCVNVYWLVAENNEFDNGVADIVMRKYTLHKMLAEGKQLSPEEREWMEARVSVQDIVKAIAKAA